MKYYFIIWIVLSPLWLKGPSISVHITTAETGEALYNAHVWNHATKTGNLKFPGFII